MGLNRLRRGLHSRRRPVADWANADPFEPSVSTEVDLNVVEVKQLWSDLSGTSVMNAAVRRRMVRTWGPCPRHAWAQAVVEIELRGGVPFTVTILYADLTGRAAATLPDPAAPPDVVRRVLAPRDICVTCDYCLFANTDPMFEERTKRANDRYRTRTLLAASRREWQQRVCPSCLAGGTGMPCRPHLVSGEVQIPAVLPAYLEALGTRLQAYQKSMTWHGPAASAAARASWIEALGFFAGWHVPLVLVD